MTKSENIGLNMFEGTDKISREAFNENFDIIDKLMKGSSSDVDGAFKEVFSGIDISGIE